MSSHHDDSQHCSRGQNKFHIRQDSQGNQAIYIPVWQNQNSHLNQSYINEKQQQVRIYKIKILHLEKHLQDYDKYFQSLYESLNLITKSQKFLKEQLIDKRTAISQLQIENQSLSTHNRIMTEKIRSLNVNQIQNKNKLEYLQQQNKLLKQRIKQLQHTIQSVPSQPTQIFRPTKSQDFQKFQTTITILEEQLASEKRQFDRTKKIIKELQRSFDDKQLQCEIFSSQIQQLSKKNSLLNKQIRKWEEQNKTLRRKNEGLQNKQNQFASKNQQFTGEKAKSQTQIKKLRQRIKQLQSELQQESRKNQIHQQTIQEWQSKIRQQKQKNQRQKRSLQQQIGAIKAKSIQQKQQLQQRNTILNKQNKNLQLVTDELKIKIQELIGQSSNADQNLNKGQQPQQFENRYNSISKSYQNLQNQLQKQNKKSQNLTKRISQAQVQMNHLKGMNQSLQGQLNFLREKKIPSQIVEKKQNKTLQLVSQLQEYRKKHNEITSQLQEIIQTRNILESQIQKLKRQIFKLREQAVKQKQEIEATNGNKNDLNQKQDSTRLRGQQVRELNDRISGLQEEIDVQSESRRQRDKVFRKLQRQIQILQQRNKKLSASLQSNQGKKAQSSWKCQKCEQKDWKIEQVQSELNQSQNIILGIEVQIQEKDVEVRRVVKQVQKGKKQVQKYKKQTQKLNKSQRKLQSLTQKLQSQLQSTKQQKYRAIQETNSMREQKQKMQEQIQSLRAKLKQHSQSLSTIGRQSTKQKDKYRDSENKYKGELRKKQQARIQLQVKIEQLEKQLTQQLSQRKQRGRFLQQSLISSPQLTELKRAKIQLLKQNQALNNQINQLNSSLNQHKNRISKLQNQMSNLAQKQNQVQRQVQAAVITDHSLCKEKQQRQKQRVYHLQRQNEALNIKFAEQMQRNEQKFRLLKESNHYQLKKLEHSNNYKIQVFQRQEARLRRSLQKERQTQKHEQNCFLSNRKPQYPGYIQTNDRKPQYPGPRQTNDSEYEVSYQKQLQKLRRMIVSNKSNEEQKHSNSKMSLQNRTHQHTGKLNSQLKLDFKQQKQRIINLYYQQQMRSSLMELQDARREIFTLRQQIYRLQEQLKLDSKTLAGRPYNKDAIYQGQLMEYRQRIRVLQIQNSLLNKQIYEIRLLNQQYLQEINIVRQQNCGWSSFQINQITRQLELYKIQMKRFQKLLRQQQRVFQARLISKEQQIGFLQMGVQSTRLGKQRGQYQGLTFQTAELKRDKSIDDSRCYASNAQQSRLKIGRFLNRTYMGVRQSRQSSNSKHNPLGTKSEKHTERTTYFQHVTN